MKPTNSLMLSNEATKGKSNRVSSSTAMDERVLDAEWVSVFEFRGTCPHCNRTRTFQFEGDLLLYRCIVCGSRIYKNRINPESSFRLEEWKSHGSSRSHFRNLVGHTGPHYEGIVDKGATLD